MTDHEYLHSYVRDLESDAILTPYLDSLYKQKGLLVERINDLDRQHQGIDLLLKESGKTWSVDEKAQMHYINRSLRTFAFEIGYIKDKEHHEGWLFDEKKLTDVYFLIMNICADTDHVTDPSQIKGCRILRIGRKRLLSSLARLGIDHDFCRQCELKARAEGWHGRIPIRSENRFNFNLTDELKEHPFNLVIKQSFLLEIGRWEV